MATEYRGLLFIGDPHLASQVPGFRKDDYPKVILGKLRFCLNYAREQCLLPAILGDLFNNPRNNANWLVGEVIELLRSQEVIGIHGNHDCREDDLLEHDTFSILNKARAFHLVDATSPWRGTMMGHKVVVGGSSWGQPIPARWDKDPDALVVWLTHHDWKVPGYDQGYLPPQAIQGIQVIVNGHIHRSLEHVVCGETTWVTPGNITRVSRSDASRAHIPSALRLDIKSGDWSLERVPVTHDPFESVFHPELVEADAPAREGRSTFIEGLAELQALRTSEGAGFQNFLETNLPQFDVDVRDDLWALWSEVSPNG
jgi:predicted phosphodiesterase